LFVIYVEQGWAYGCKVEWEQLWEIENLKKGRGQRVIGKGKLKSIRNMIYLLLRRIDIWLWDNWLMQILEIDQSIDHPQKILRGV
jgi:hypothetical protein